MNPHGSQSKCNHTAREINSPNSKVDCLVDSTNLYVLPNFEEFLSDSSKFENDPQIEIVKAILAIYEKNKPSSNQGIVASIFETYDRLVKEQKAMTFAIS
jgi:hypothetical protein